MIILQTPSVFYAGHVQLKDVGPAVKEATDGGGGTPKIPVDEFLDVGALRFGQAIETVGARGAKTGRTGLLGVDKYHFSIAGDSGRRQ